MKPLGLLCGLAILAGCIEIRDFQMVPRSGERRSCTLVAADYGDPDGVNELQKAIRGTDCDLYVIEKGEQCPQNVDCQRVANLGMEGGSVADFIYVNYENLPDVLIFTPTTLFTPWGIPKWDRLRFVQKFLGDRHSARFQCEEMNRGTVRGQGNFKLYGTGKWNDKIVGGLKREGETTLDGWMGKHTDLHACIAGNTSERQSPDCKMLNSPVCAHFVFRTTRDLLLQRPRQLYLNVSQELGLFQNPLSGHFLERAVGAIYGGNQEWWNDGGGKKVPMNRAHLTELFGDSEAAKMEEWPDRVYLTELFGDSEEPDKMEDGLAVPQPPDADGEHVSIAVGALGEGRQLRKADSTDAYQ